MKKMKESRIFPALSLAILALFLCFACNEDDPGIKTFKVKVQLEYPEPYSPEENVTVTLRNTLSGDISEATTNSTGVAEFTVLAGPYEAASSETRTSGLNIAFLNGSSNVVVSDAWQEDKPVLISLTKSEKNQLIIKELYVGGCKKDDGSGAFQRDPYMILYNNSEAEVSVDSLTIGAVFPSNANAPNYFMEGEDLIYKNENWLPVAFGAWAIRGNLKIAPGKQIVIAMNSANDHTLVHSKSVNLANSEYYVAYDISVGYTHTLYHPAPSNLIPDSHYLKGYKFPGVTSNAWTFSVSSPAFFIFAPKVSFASFSSDPNNKILHGTGASQAAIKIPRAWVIDGIEVFQKEELAKSKKRLTPDIDGGYVALTNSQGYTLYRNVDKEASEAIEGNAGKIVYNYALGTSGSSDPSGIDAEASTKNGARIVYKDTNNSTNDFHQRSRASLRN